MLPKTMYDVTVTVPIGLSPMAMSGDSPEKIVEEYLSMVRRSINIKVTNVWINGIKQQQGGCNESENV
tara:strand:- start:261 stop:464 length:204 start_codon:yes stop_codon:yes gene_type:complete